MYQPLMLKKADLDKMFFHYGIPVGLLIIRYEQPVYSVSVIKYPFFHLCLPVLNHSNRSNGSCFQLTDECLEAFVVRIEQLLGCPL